jgi:hypothetical protein
MAKCKPCLLVGLAIDEPCRLDLPGHEVSVKPPNKLSYFHVGIEAHVTEKAGYRGLR